jgi:hypothetical protein
MSRWSWQQVVGVLLLITSLVFGSVARYVDLFNLGYYFDTITTQYWWAVAVADMGLINMWQHYVQYLDYPILNLAFVGSIEYIIKIFGGGPHEFVAGIKSVYWLADLALLATLYKLFKQQGVQDYINYGVLALVYSIPSLWFVSGVWGQSDTMHALLVLWSLQLLYTRKLYSQVLGGVLLAVALQFKLQVLLVVLIMVLLWSAIHKRALWQSWKPMLPWVAISGVLSLMSAAALHVAYKNTVVYIDTKEQLVNQFSAVHLMFAVGFLIAPIVLSIWFVIKSRVVDKLQSIHRFLASFFVVSTFWLGVSVLINPLRFAAAVIAPLVSPYEFSGSANLSNGWVRLVDVLGIVEYKNTGKAFIISIFITLAAVWLWHNYRTAKDSLLSMVWNSTQFILLYFILSTGRVHSRYGHFAIVFLLVLLPFLKTRWYYWLAYIGMLGAYGINQIVVYFKSSGDNGDSWARVILSLLPDDNYFWIVGIMVVSVLVWFLGYVRGDIILTEKRVRTTN